MRPTCLHLESFGSFREPMTVSFSDVDYFALVGPTGAGKSTVIDAICFALYGTVPRWDNENVIAHALAPSADSGAVALVFETAGRRYAVVRSLRRDAKGKVHTKEARLDELDRRVPAGAELPELLAAVVRPIAEGETVTAEVQRVTGLEYRFFTQCVVLPQGKFAEFLHSKPRQRQDLLVQLLDAEVYEKVRKRAEHAEGLARQRAELSRTELSHLRGVGEQEERAAAERLERLRALRDRAQGDLDALRGHDETIRKLAELRAATAQTVAALGALAMPADVPTLAESQQAADLEVTARAADVDRLTEEEQRAHDAATGLGDKAALAMALAAHQDKERSARDLATAETESDRSRQVLGERIAQAERAQAALEEAEHQRDRLRDAHTAADLAQRLVVGEPCPTCLRPVAELPRHHDLSDLRTAERTVAARRTAMEQAIRTRHAADAESVQLVRRVQELRRRLAELESRAAGGEDAAERLRAIDVAERQAMAARKAARQARDLLTAARRGADELRVKAEQSWRDVDAARDTVVALGAPALDRQDLGRAWGALLVWRDEVMVRERHALGAHDEEIADARRRREEAQAALMALLSEHEIRVDPRGGAGEAITAAVTAAAGWLDRVTADRARAARLAEQAAASEQEARVARELALLLRADRFERWLCEEALGLLASAASQTLHELSDGQYELGLSDKGDIEVIDHAEAGMRRSVRTLSGGETFQAALALALALSSQVAGLAATAARSLDSIFLDEGFGTLDPATLDTVATTLERLATSQERMVGVVTHVPALADRVPVRFEVSRDAKGSHLRKAAS
ncbi:SMC family ATPase [Streptosporangiaceae bacterium NEAU-GS5]|nr:SMC family ATPase [Streptosporangiaceae bacterium NEAU-GS5]